MAVGRLAASDTALHGPLPERSGGRTSADEAPTALQANLVPGALQSRNGCPQSLHSS